MIQSQIISSVIEWERRLEVEQGRREIHRADPYVNYLAAPRPGQKEEKQREESRKHIDFVKALSSYSPT
jgi:hypothetical protein